MSLLPIYFFVSHRLLIEIEPLSTLRLNPFESLRVDPERRCTESPKAPNIRPSGSTEFAESLRVERFAEVSP
jgi:hypothetical protein